jgi:hypothetical protein
MGTLATKRSVVDEVPIRQDSGRTPPSFMWEKGVAEPVS